MASGDDDSLGPDSYVEPPPEFQEHFPLQEKSDFGTHNRLRPYDRRKPVHWPRCMHGDNCIVQVHDDCIDGGRRFWRCPRGWNCYAPDNCQFTKWVDPPAIYPYQEYINYLHLVIDDLKREINSTANPTAARSANLTCTDPYCCCPCHIDPPPYSQPSPPPCDPPSGYSMPPQNPGDSVSSLGGYNSFR